jgi:TonB-dependent SusC/RagA subfamily outer membrane receptor
MNRAASLSRPVPHRWLAGLALWVLTALASPAAAQQTGAITGRVEDDETGHPVAGVELSVDGTSRTAITATDGRFRLTGIAAGEAVLRARAFGYLTSSVAVSVPAGGVAEARVRLQRDALDLDRIVVTGTGHRARRREVAHSVGSVRPSSVTEPVSSVTRLLGSRLAGVTVQRASGMAGSGSQIRLRGNGSASLGNEPLVYVDGVRIRSEGYPRNVPKIGNDTRGANVTASPLEDLNPADIDRIEVVKGPAATTLYGAEAASGVIEIFTRRGGGGGPVWRARLDQGVERVRAFGSENDPYMGLGPWLRTAWTQRYAASVAGGRRFGYYVSSSADLRDGLLPDDRTRRVVGRANLDYRTDALALEWSASHSMSSIDNTAAAINPHGLVINAFRGEANYIGDGSPEALERLLEYDIHTDLRHTTVGLTATWAASSDFTNRVTIGLDRAAAHFRQLRPVGFILAPDGILAEEDWVDRTTTAEYVGRLDLGLSPIARTTLAWGVQSVTSDVVSDAGYAEGFPEDASPSLENGALSLAFHERLRVRNTGAFVQSVLGVSDRYFLTTGLRVDGSTAFGSDLGLQLYPRLGGSYVISDEPFWPAALGRVKARVSYGHAGKAPGVIDALRTWNQVDFGGEPAYLPGAVGNPELGPERMIELETGFDGSFLDGALSATFNYYRQRTTDALLPVPPIPSRGFLEPQLQNVGTIRNTGIELAVEIALFSRGAWAWTVGSRLYTNRSELTRLGAADSLFLGNAGWLLEGEPVPAIRGLRVRNPDALADPIVEPDHVFGPNLPSRTVGLSSSLRFPKEIELHARAEYMGGHYLYDRVGNHLARRGRYPPCDQSYAHLAADRVDRLTAWERVWCVPAQVRRGEGPVYPADFVRLREVTLTLPIPRSLLGHGAVLSFSALDTFTWTGDAFRLFDPEMAGDRGMHGAVRYIDAHLPPPRSFVVSIRTGS